MKLRRTKQCFLLILLTFCLVTFSACGLAGLPVNLGLNFGLSSVPEAPDREFSERLNPYYALLDEEERDIYAQFVEAAEAMQSDFVPCHTISYDSLEPIYAAVCYDQTQLFWLSENYRSLYDSVTGEVTEVRMHYTLTAEELPAAQEELEKAVQIYLDAAAGLSTSEKEKVIHDLLCRNVQYDTGKPASQSVYNALVDGCTACSGYSKAFRYLMTALDIPCYFCYGQGYCGSGDTGYVWEYHAWNLIQLGEGWYNMDVTWDATSLYQLDLISYAFYNRTEEDFSERHVRDENCTSLPCGNATEYSCEVLYGWDPELMFAEQLGIQEITDVYSLQDYYDACLQSILESGGEESESDLLIHGDDCLDEITTAIDNREYMDVYVSDAMTDFGWNSCSFQLQTSIYTVRENLYLFIQNNTLSPDA